MHSAIERYGGALEPFEVLVVADELQLRAAEGPAQTDEAFPQCLHPPGKCTDEVQHPGRHRSVGAPDEPAEVRAGKIEARGAELGVEVAAEGVRVRHRSEELRRNTKRQRHLRQVATARLDVDVALLELQGEPWSERTDETARDVRVPEELLCGVARAQVGFGVQARLQVPWRYSERPVEVGQRPVRVVDRLVFRT